jgi:hypothetical protein
MDYDKERSLQYMDDLPRLMELMTFIREPLLVGIGRVL